MKKFISVIGLVCLIAVPAFAGEWHDSYAYMWEDPSYVTLMDALKENRAEDEVAAAYDRYVSGAGDYERCLTELHMVRYFMDRGEEDAAVAHYETMDELYKSIGFESEMAQKTAEFDLLSAEYYIWHNSLGAGLQSSNVGKELYKMDPHEYRIAIGEAFRLLSTPHIAGGSPKKALKLFREIEEGASGMNKVDEFSLYSGLGMSSYERKEYEASEEYFNKACEIYPADPAMQDYISKLSKR